MSDAEDARREAVAWVAGAEHVWALNALSCESCENSGECAEYYSFDMPAEACKDWCGPCRTAYYQRREELRQHRAVMAAARGTGGGRGDG